MSAGISEKFSEKAKRGRPRLLPPKLEEVYRSAVGSYSSPRTVQNKYYEIRAVTVLGFADDGADTTPYRWLCRAGIPRGVSQRRYYRSAILAELGRIADDEVLRAYARLICELKPKTQEAVRMLRGWRINKG